MNAEATRDPRANDRQKRELLAKEREAFLQRNNPNTITPSQGKEVLVEIERENQVETEPPQRELEEQRMTWTPPQNVQEDRQPFKTVPIIRTPKRVRFKETERDEQEEEEENEERPKKKSRRDKTENKTLNAFLESLMSNTLYVVGAMVFVGIKTYGFQALQNWNTKNQNSPQQISNPTPRVHLQMGNPSANNNANVNGQLPQTGNAIITNFFQ